MCEPNLEPPEPDRYCKCGCGAKATHNGYNEWCDPDAPDTERDE